MLNVKNGDAFRGSFIVQDCISSPGFFDFPNEGEYCTCEICEALCWYFDGDFIESIDCF